MSSNSKVYKSSKIVFDEETNADLKFTFVSENKIELVYAHTTVLYIESPKFYKEIILGNIHGSNAVIDNIPIVVFRLFLEMIYKLDTSNIHLKYFRELAELCKRYDVPGEKELMNALKEISVDNIFYVIQVSLDFNFEDVKKKAMEFVKNNFMTLLKRADFVSCSEEVLKEILKVEDMSKENEENKEVNVVTAISRFINENGKKSSVGYEKSKPFYNIIKLIRFPVMTAIEFADCLDKNPGILSDEDSIRIFKGIIRQKTDNLGFPNADRFGYVDVLKIEPSTKLLTMVMTGASSAWGTGQIDNTNVTFTVNVPIVIINAGILLSEGQSSIVIKLMNSENQTISTGEVMGPDYNSQHYATITFKELRVLYPNRKYCIHINYKRQGQISRYYNAYVPTMPNTVKQDSVELKFETMNFMLYSLSVKPLK